MRVVASPGGQVGTIEGGFGKSGKFRVRFDQPLRQPAAAAAAAGQGGGQAAAQAQQPPVRLTLSFRRYLFDQDRHHMVQ